MIPPDSNPNATLAPTLTTPRLLLTLYSPSSPAHAIHASALFNDPKVIALQGDLHLRTPEEWAAKVETFTLQPKYASGVSGICIYSLWLREDSTGSSESHGKHAEDGDERGQYVGLVSLRQAYKLPDIGYVLMPAFWGQGLATEACSELLRFVREELGIERLIGVTPLGHVRSGRILEKVGLVNVGVRKYDQEYEREVFVAEGMVGEEVMLERPGE